MKKMTNKMAKKAMGLKGFMNSMSKKKGEMGMSNPNAFLTKPKKPTNTMPSNKPSFSPNVAPSAGKVYNAPPKTTREMYDYAAKKSASIPTRTMKKGGLKSVDAEKNPGLAKLPTDVRNKMGYMQMGGMSTKMMDKAKAKTYSEKRYEASNPMYKTAADKGTVKKSFETNKASLDSLLLNKSKKKGQKGMNVMDEAMDNATPSIPNSYYKMGGKKQANPLAAMIKKSKPKMAMGGDFFPQNPLMASKYKGDTLMGQSFKKGGMVKKKKK